MTWPTAPTIATDVASTTLSVAKYSTRNTMVEKKSAPSLANTSFIVVLSLAKRFQAKPAPHLDSGVDTGSREENASNKNVLVRAGQRVSGGNPVLRLAILR